jgi:hypothetical protein
LPTPKTEGASSRLIFSDTAPMPSPGHLPGFFAGVCAACHVRFWHLADGLCPLMAALEGKIDPHDRVSLTVSVIYVRPERTENNRGANQLPATLRGGAGWTFSRAYIDCDLSQLSGAAHSHKSDVAIRWQSVAPAGGRPGGRTARFVPFDFQIAGPLICHRRNVRNRTRFTRAGGGAR